MINEGLFNSFYYLSSLLFSYYYFYIFIMFSSKDDNVTSFEYVEEDGIEGKIYVMKERSRGILH